MDKEPEKSLGNQQTRTGKKQAGPELDTARSLSDSQTLVGGLAADAETLSDGLELTDLSARYTIVKPLGQGGMGEVLLATDNRLKRQVAIKRIRGEHARSRAAVQRFLTEAQAIAALNHPNIVQVYDYGRDQEGPFLIMEYVDGQSLLERCKDNPLPVAEAVELTCEMLGGLGRAHELGIIHRDIKPANILLTKDGRPKLTDFGLAKQTATDHGQTVTGAVLGTVDFMPPEQRRDSTQVDARSDLWSLAATLYQMLTGKSPKIIRFDLLPPQLVGVMGQALEENPAQRFQSAIEFRDGLRKVPQAEEVSAGELVAGQCPQCGTRNSESVRFCKECSAALKVPCLKCEADIAIWDKGCTECGTRQADFLERKRSELETLRGNVERLCEAGRLGEALQQLESIGELRHPRLQDYRHWVERTRPDLSQQAERLVALSGSALAEARAHRAAWDYRAAIQTLERLPPEAFGDDHRTLRAQLQTEWSEFQEKLQEIQQRVKARQLDGLLPLVERAVELRGNREDLKKLLGQLQQREAKLAASQLAAKAGPLGALFEAAPSPVTQPGFLGKKKVRKGFLQKHRKLTTTGAVGIVFLLFVGWLFSRGSSGNGKAPTATANNQSINNPVADSEAVARRSSPLTTPPASKSNSLELTRGPELGSPSSATPSDTGRTALSGSSPETPEGASIGEKVVAPAAASFPFDDGIALKHQESWAEYLKVPVEVQNSIGMKFKLIPPGRFVMGDASGEADEHPHEVTISRPFYFGVYEVTQEQYLRVMAKNPSRFNGAANPVEQVSVQDAVDFCQLLSELPKEREASSLYRLPSEAEWEFACRAGTTTKFSFGDDPDELNKYGWYGGNSSGKLIDFNKFCEVSGATVQKFENALAATGCRPRPVGLLKPNPWGLFDIHGNVWEICQDSIADYPRKSVFDPLVVDRSKARVFRGGGWDFVALQCRSAKRGNTGPGYRQSALGIRVVLNCSDALTEK